MKKFFPVYVRVPLLFLLYYFLIEWFLGGTVQKPAFVDHPEAFILMGLFIFATVAVEIVGSATNKVLRRLMTPEEIAEQERKDNLAFSQRPWVKKIMQKLTKTKELEQENTMLLDHDYDGIKELDNELPPWWVGLFYVTIIFAVVYLFKYHLFGGDNQITEFDKSMAIAREQVEEYKKNAPDMMTADQAQYLTDASSLAAGKQIFDTNCAVCHRPDGGGGVGPNLADDHWIIGGGMKDIFHTISEGGRPGKGMVDWKKTLKPSEIEKVASYVISLNGTNPENPKDAEGDIIWSKKELEVTEEVTTDTDSPAETTQTEEVK